MSRLVIPSLLLQLLIPVKTRIFWLSKLIIVLKSLSTLGPWDLFWVFTLFMDWLAWDDISVVYVTKLLLGTVIVFIGLNILYPISIAGGAVMKKTVIFSILLPSARVSSKLCVYSCVTDNIFILVSIKIDYESPTIVLWEFNIGPIQVQVMVKNLLIFCWDNLFFINFVIFQTGTVNIVASSCLSFTIYLLILRDQWTDTVSSVLITLNSFCS